LPQETKYLLEINVPANATHGFSRIRYQNQGRISNKAKKSKSAHLEIIVREVKA
jgi:hypothetical protein